MCCSEEVLPFLVNGQGGDWLSEICLNRPLSQLSAFDPSSVKEQWAALCGTRGVARC